MGSEHCVSCGRKIEFGPNGYPNHHCPTSHEASKLGAHRRFNEDTTERTRTFGQRLSDGMLMLGKN